MDLMLLRMFQGQVLLQCEFMMVAAGELNRGLELMNTRHTFYALQNLLNAGANISKALWGSGGKRAKQRKPLRDSIGVADDSPLRAVAMRNNFEHFDDRLDKWWETSKRHNAVDLTIAPRSAVIGVDSIGLVPRVRP